MNEKILKEIRSFSSFLEEGCCVISEIDSCHQKMDEYGKKHGITVTYAVWHPNPEYRIFKTDSLLSRNDKYPSGLVLVPKNGEPIPFCSHSSTG